MIEVPVYGLSAEHWSFLVRWKARNLSSGQSRPCTGHASLIEHRNGLLLPPIAVQPIPFGSRRRKAPRRGHMGAGAEGPSHRVV